MYSYMLVSQLVTFLMCYSAVVGPFLLTHLLLDLLVTAAHMTGDARIINVSCSEHDSENLSSQGSPHYCLRFIHLSYFTAQQLILFPTFLPLRGLTCCGGEIH